MKTEHTHSQSQHEDAMRLYSGGSSLSLNSNPGFRFGSNTNETNESEPTSDDFTFTAPKRGHRHKRSMAISGDFDFVPVPPSLPFGINNNNSGFNMQRRGSSPGPILHPDMTNNNISSFQSPIRSRNLEPQYSSPAVITTPTDSLDSPNFFMSETSKFSSNIKGVPDAIINLDDILTTRPKVFGNQSHRRTESAPADLNFLLPKFAVNNSNNDHSIINNNNYRTQNILIEEESDSENEFTPDSNTYSDNNTLEENKNLNSTKLQDKYTLHNYPSREQFNTQNKLMSPIKSMAREQLRSLSSNVVTTEYQYSKLNSNGSTNSDSTKYNTLKINRQKERYSHYTRNYLSTSKMTTTSSSLSQTSNMLNPSSLSSSTNNSNYLQTQTLKEQVSSSSLSSVFLKTPSSSINTPARSASTPSTPLSDNNSETNNRKFENTTNHNNVQNANMNDEYRNKLGFIPTYKKNQTMINNFDKKKHHNNLPYSTLTFSSPNKRSNHAHSYSTNTNLNTFNFESKMYEIPYDELMDSCSIENDPSRKKKDTELNESTSETIRASPLLKSNDSNKFSSFSSDDNLPINEIGIESPALSGSSTNDFKYDLNDLLMGGPGDSVDLSHMTEETIFTVNDDSSKLEVYNSLMTTIEDNKSTSLNTTPIIKLNDDIDSSFINKSITNHSTETSKISKKTPSPVKVRDITESSPIKIPYSNPKINDIGNNNNNMKNESVNSSKRNIGKRKKLLGWFDFTNIF